MYGKGGVEALLSWSYPWETMPEGAWHLRLWIKYCIKYRVKTNNAHVTLTLLHYKVSHLTLLV